MGVSSGEGLHHSSKAGPLDRTVLLATINPLDAASGLSNPLLAWWKQHCPEELRLISMSPGRQALKRLSVDLRLSWLTSQT